MDKMNAGFWLCGTFLGAEMRRDKEGKEKGWVIAVSVGVDSYKLFLSFEPRGFGFGDSVMCRVRPRCFNGMLWIGCEDVQVVA